jgi:glucose-1-phosphate thymidylyltransferase
MGYFMRKLGIILSAGKSTRLYPATFVTTKQLLPIYDKPLIYYPLSTLMLADIRDYIIITSPHEEVNFQKLFANAKQELGINVTILTQKDSLGIADAFRIVHAHLGERVYEYDTHALILGDNIFYGAGFSGILSSLNTSHNLQTATVFAYAVKNPEQFGVIKLENNKPINIEEKPKNPKSNLAVTGLYFYPSSVYLQVEVLSPSERGELEISDLNKLYLKQSNLNVVELPRGMVWFDTGTPDSMLEASNFIYNIQKHQNYLVGSPHEVAYINKWIVKEQLHTIIDACEKTPYGQYLKKLCEEL